MAIAEAQLAACYNRAGFAVVDHATYVMAGDGDLMEGVASEAASLAGHLKLGKLICLYDDNRVTLAAGTDITFSEDRARRLRQKVTDLFRELQCRLRGELPSGWDADIPVFPADAKGIAPAWKSR